MQTKQQLTQRAPLPSNTPNITYTFEEDVLELWVKDTEITACVTKDCWLLYSANNSPYGPKKLVSKYRSTDRVELSIVWEES